MGFVSSYVRCVGKVWPLVILLWLGLLVFGCIRGPFFLLHTDNAISETAGTPSATANAVLNSVYDISQYTPWIIMAKCPIKTPSDLAHGCDGASATPVLSQKTRAMFEETVKALRDKHPDVFDWDKTMSWFTLDGTPGDSLKSNFVSPDGRVTYLQLYGDRKITQATRFTAYDTLQDVLPKLKDKYCQNCDHVGTTGGDQLTSDVSIGLARHLLKTNAFIIPIAAAILVYMVGNWRLLLITLFNVAVVVLGTFAIADWICDHWIRPQSITAQMIEVISVAITIDYSLFMFTRFIQELNVKRKRWSIRRHHYFKTVTSDTTSPDDIFVPPHLQNRPQYGQEYFGLTFDQSLDSEHDPHPGLSNPSRELLLSALISTVEHSGHVVVVSGITLILAFSGFVISRCNFLIQPALFTAMGVGFAILTSLTTSIALIQAFPSFFTDFNILPQFMYACCKERRKTQLFDTDFTDDFIFIEDPDELSYQAAVQNAEQYGTNNAPNRFQSHNSFQYANSTYNNNNNNNNGFPGAVNDRNNKYSDRSQLISTNAPNSTGYGGFGPSDGLNSSPSQVVAFKGQTKDVSTVVDIPTFHKSISYKVGRWFVKLPWSMIIVILVFGAMGFFSYFVSKLELTSAYAIGIPRDSPALETLELVEKSFPPGIIQPVYMLMRWTPKPADPPVEPDAKNDLMFERGNEYLKLFSSVTKISPSFTHSPFYWQGNYIPDTKSTPQDFGYMGLFMETSKGNATQVTYLITLLSPISPDSPDLVPILRDIRSKVTEPLTEKYKDDTDNLTEYFLTGYKVQEQDTIDETQATFPLMLSVTFAVVIVIVAVLLKSAFVPIRLILTLALPLACTFGLTVLVFQYGWLGWTGLRMFNPVIKQIYWELPPFCAVVLLSLALDYDVFIISRIIEHRVNNFSNPSSILLALYETSSIITSAGVIMALTFSGLFFMQSDALCQLGFILVVSVLIDCFITRTIIVPCVLSVGDKVAWWPRKVNFRGLRHYDGTRVD